MEKKIYETREELFEHVLKKLLHAATEYENITNFFNGSCKREKRELLQEIDVHRLWVVNELRNDVNLLRVLEEYDVKGYLKKCKVPPLREITKKDVDEFIKDF